MPQLLETRNENIGITRYSSLCTMPLSRLMFSFHCASFPWKALLILPAAALYFRVNLFRTQTTKDTQNAFRFSFLVLKWFQPRRISSWYCVIVRVRLFLFKTNLTRTIIQYQLLQFLLYFKVFCVASVVETWQKTLYEMHLYSAVS